MRRLAWVAVALLAVIVACAFYTRKTMKPSSTIHSEGSEKSRKEKEELQKKEEEARNEAKEIARQKQESIREALARPGQIVVVKNNDGKYWAFPTSGIERIGEGPSVSLKKNTLVAFGTGKGSPENIAEVLLDGVSLPHQFFTDYKDASVEGKHGLTTGDHTMVYPVELIMTTSCKRWGCR